DPRALPGRNLRPDRRLRDPLLPRRIRPAGDARPRDRHAARRALAPGDRALPVHRRRGPRAPPRAVRSLGLPPAHRPLRARPVGPMSLRACIVARAQNGGDLMGACIQALAAQEGVMRGEYGVLLVLDRCTDATEARARAAAHDLDLTVLPASGA